MDKNQIVSKINSIWPGAVLEARSFGRSGAFSVWLESQALLKVALALKEDPEWKLNWLENLSVVELEEVMVVTYFLRSTVNSRTLVLRTSAVPSSPKAWVKFPSVSHIWSMSAPFEHEAKELFGIEFDGLAPAEFQAKVSEAGENEFPLRKKFELKKVTNSNHTKKLDP